MSKIDQRIIDAFDKAHGFSLEDSLIMLAYVGSTSHNTYVPKDDPDCIDDVDMMGVIIPPIEYTLGLKSFEHWTFAFEELDVVLYSLEKFIRLLVKSNPNVLGTMWLKDEHYILERKSWFGLKMWRSLFSTKAAHGSFAGYANGQLKKMTHFDLATQEKWEDAIKLIEAVGWTKEQIIKNEHREMPKWEGVNLWAHGIDDKVYLRQAALEYAMMAIKTIHAQHFQGYMGEKRKNLVKKYGYDAKNAAHLIRLLRMCVEFLQTGEMQVFREGIDAQQIKDIKSGKWSLEEVQREAQELFASAEQARDASPLPDEPDEEEVGQLLVALQLTHYGYVYRY
jgi:uncharacterized protein